MSQFERQPETSEAFCLGLIEGICVRARSTPWPVTSEAFCLGLIEGAQHLIGIARPLYAKEPIGLDLKETVYAFDSTTTCER